MEGSPDHGRGSGASSSQFGDSVFRSQVLLAGGIALVVCITVSLSDTRPDDSAAFFFGLVLALWVTIGSAIVPWLQFAHRWQMLVPMLDIVAIGMLRIAEPGAGFGIVMIFPVIWLATSFGRAGFAAGPSLVTIMLGLQVGLDQLGIYVSPNGTTSPVAAASLAVALTFVAAVTWATSARVESQRVLLRRQATMLEAALTRARVQESTLRAAFDSVEFAVISLDRTGQIVTSNRATRALLADLGLPENTPWDRFPLYKADKVTPVVPAEFPHLRALRGTDVDGETYWIGHRTGTRFTIDLTARLLHDQDGGIDRVVVVLRDISAEIRAITDRDDLVTSMSHELRTPLSSILGYIDLALESDDLPGEAREMLDIALANAQRLNSLVSDLLSARSTSPANAIVLRLAPCNVSDLVNESLDAIRPLSTERLISVRRDISAGVDAVVDAFRLRQVIDNLLSNAIKYNRIGGRITVTVTATVHDDRPAAEIRVADTGRGMTLEERRGLFERFYRAESVRGSSVHGSGLGLSISREIVVLHDGTIEVDSEPDRGTEVTVTIPRKPIPTSAATTAADDTEKS